MRSSSTPHFIRLTRRIYASADTERIGVTLKQLATLASLRERGELPQQMLCDVLKTTQNTVVVWLNELINRSDVDHLIYGDAVLEALTANRIDARIRGAPIAERGVGLGVATSHELELEPVGKVISATITVETRE